MPEIYCRKCGAIVKPTDTLCRRCGSSLGSTTISEGDTRGTNPEQVGGEPVGVEVGPTLKSPRSKLTARDLIFLTIALLGIVIILMANQQGGRPAIAIEFVGTSTTYPTHTPYFTATTYEITTPYPTVAFYPTTGAIATRVPPTPTTCVTATLVPGKLLPLAPDFCLSLPLYPPNPILNSNSSCELLVTNQNTDLDSVVILSDVDTNAIMAAVYVRASDSFRKSGISIGTYYTYIAIGQDWDTITSRFKNNAIYLRYKESNTLSACSGGMYSSDQQLEITLTASIGSGSDTINVSPDNFPSIDQ